MFLFIKKFLPYICGWRYFFVVDIFKNDIFDRDFETDPNCFGTKLRRSWNNFNTLVSEAEFLWPEIKVTPCMYFILNSLELLFGRLIRVQILNFDWKIFSINFYSE